MLTSDSTLFCDYDMNGEEFWMDFDGAEGHGFWVGNPENAIPLSHEVTHKLIDWIKENWT